MKKIDHNRFLIKTQTFLLKIAENCDHNIDPRWHHSSSSHKLLTKILFAILLQFLLSCKVMNKIYRMHVQCKLCVEELHFTKRGSNIHKWYTHVRLTTFSNTFFFFFFYLTLRRDIQQWSGTIRIGMKGTKKACT
jgi:hypothetical protein